MRNAFVLLPFVAFIGAAPVLAADGAITFSGVIREPTCLMAGTQPACLRPAPAETRPARLDVMARVPLFAYALTRDRAARWRVVDIIYR
ncbi:hypothetical protein FIV34_04720 [Luteibacter pinisoli]|uniref:Type 1 fimbrial protein n=1 Tax=Luteibacter pinisoli TaxID=2589080 RepID=A0A4Y5Z0F5_9GAMM|nr:hypothetical protein [Luteibacter pinisoli]QDE38554.1 hypothetical protein FIV34_04720 [Luteibacter pinisoli]